MNTKNVGLLVLLVATAGCHADTAPPTGTETGDDKRNGRAGESPERISFGRQQSLLEARSGFRTAFRPSSYEPSGPAPSPPPDVMQIVKYPAPVGDLVAYLTPDPMDGERHPAIVWAHGGFGGIGSWLWEPRDELNDQSVRHYLGAGLVVMCPSWRGENDNPGQHEMFYGEVDDLLAAREFVASLSYVDSKRVYLAGHSSGGTLALLAATATDKFRAIFSLGGNPDVVATTCARGGDADTPFDCSIAMEAELRSAINFSGAIRTPTFYFEGQEESYCPFALDMETRARWQSAPLTVSIIEGGDHFNILASLHRFIAEQILADTGDKVSITITPELANAACRDVVQAVAAARAAAAAEYPLFELTPAAKQQLLASMRDAALDPQRVFVRAGISDERFRLGFDESFDPQSDLRAIESGVVVVIDRASAEQLRGYLLHYNADRGGFAFIDPWTRKRASEQD
jgi:dienelactone hydrolase